ncbi:hypothetical protein K491DRAFT_710965 [Lophiostoma macrostomum CBS 122681]|uniref:DUF6594 domain-containing protein n=1 Tax=Lophiostoma macrostomum CBS 122681 TaxID=1314788 RepID=A0A6A6TRZ7_9PLEO|nr:hypothetical protein K491DRAFT_710965 [Lophiostoma macrostomum CBS 122681]
MANLLNGDIQDGYRGLAAYMGPHLHSGMGIFRRFSKLNTLNLLYMQAEILVLEQELHILACIDTTILEHQDFAKNVRKMKQSPHSAQWKKMLEIREMLKAYNQALCCQAELARLNDARDFDRNSIDVWIRDSNGGKKFLSGCEARPWMSVEQPDLLSVSSRSTDDLFTRFFEEHKPMKGQEGTNIAHYGKAGFKRMARILNTMLSALLPSLSVLALYLIHNPLVRLGAIVGFSAAFSLILTLFTKARPVEVFAATAAFASVQVVFVGGGTGGSSGTCECA